MGSNGTPGTVMVQGEKDSGCYHAQPDMDYPRERRKTSEKKKNNLIVFYIYKGKEKLHEPDHGGYCRYNGWQELPKL